MITHTHTIIPCFCSVDQGTANVIIGQGPMCCVELFLAGKCPRHTKDNEREEV